jgi:hypothetical protein
MVQLQAAYLPHLLEVSVYGSSPENGMLSAG